MHQRLTSFRPPNEAKAAPDIHNRAPEPGPPVMSPQDILRRHVIQLLTRTEPQPTEIGLHDLVKLIRRDMMARL